MKQGRVEGVPRELRVPRKGNYERLFDEARGKVGAWEKANPK